MQHTISTSSHTETIRFAVPRNAAFLDSITYKPMEKKIEWTVDGGGTEYGVECDELLTWARKLGGNDAVAALRLPAVDVG